MWQETARKLAELGLDLAIPLATEALPASVPARVRTATFGRANAQALLVGNTRVLWDYFERARAQPPVAGVSNPLDTYVELALRQAVVGASHLYLGHRAEPDFVPLTHVARAAGLKLGDCQLAIHPTYGPWISLRALVVFDAPAETAAAPVKATCDCARHCAPAFAAAQGRPLADWLSVRDACPVGREHRFSEEQLTYHYERRPRR